MAFNLLQPNDLNNAAGGNIASLQGTAVPAAPTIGNSNLLKNGNFNGGGSIGPTQVNAGGNQGLAPVAGGGGIAPISPIGVNQTTGQPLSPGGNGPPPIIGQAPAQQSTYQPPQALPPSQAPISAEQAALGGGNKNNIQSFLQSANGGYGNTNSGMNGGAPAQPAVQNIVNPNPNMPTIQPVAPGLQSPNINGNPPPAQSTPAPQPPVNKAPIQNGMVLNKQPAPMQGALPPPQPAVQAPNLNINQNQRVAMSDASQKTDIAPAEHKLEQFLSSINAYNYSYKEPEKDGVGTFTSPMAQELEQTELGKQAVIDTPRGKMVDYARLGGVNLAAAAVLHRQQERLQKQFDDMKRQIKLVKGK